MCHSRLRGVDRLGKILESLCIHAEVRLAQAGDGTCFKSDCVVCIELNVVDEAKDPAAVGGMQVIVVLLDDLGARSVVNPFSELTQSCGGVCNLPLTAGAVLKSRTGAQMPFFDTQVGWYGPHEMEQSQDEGDGDLNQKGRHVEQKPRS